MSDQPTPQLDPTPDEGPGGADAIERDPDDFPLVTPDQPRSAQVEETDIPDAIEEGDEGKQEGEQSDPESGGDTSAETPA